ncbi:MAG: hypothetical protein IJN90_01535 [Bacilli bacterium]|nr:hypothetical protein [Bacilli bacterium]
MKKRKTFIAMALVIAVLVLGVGYAAISNINLTINGTANVTANADFTVEFDTTHEVTNGAYTDAKTATMTVNLSNDVKTATAVYKINNKSTELGATLTANVANDDETLNKYVEFATAFYANENCTEALNGPVAHGQTAYLKVTANLKQNPAQDVKDKVFTVTITAEPADAN